MIATTTTRRIGLGSLAKHFFASLIEKEKIAFQLVVDDENGGYKDNMVGFVV